MTNHFLTLWDILATTFSIFFFIAYLLILFQVISDLFRDHELSGFYKAIWILFLLFIPLLTSLVYLITRGKGMAQRYRASVQKSVSETNEYIRHVAGKSPAEQIADAKKLLDEGTITESEYQQLKVKALS
ncbi:TPA: SHOCT domain-containing protein [Yersinia enterocolitica]|uniref:SHOCT domain-containing protein n=1 Tax=Yersinia enterocolitica TaxID=630 RepID=UPI001C60BDAA|nr:SHOCT domain-containing protein [Yersinia enterocolitica]EKN3724058.1 PLDc N-terminal domain-containing protein [Yersinia enterocolitica]EKN3726944.1 PLDc N-terminal domain-containing protein [Yersinia enterocolitica]EKN4808359.1 PLDc N-terminal domain-containing protein [Yersinia enterocolitica]EKN4811579.1 PLDc N-terminal domain-containing protein [Yersinia enterocolitica]MBW5821580.1 PLDc N-terminal domain-containing protein [Yersinia enterocolitica]